MPITGDCWLKMPNCPKCNGSPKVRVDMKTGEVFFYCADCGAIARISREKKKAIWEVKP